MISRACSMFVERSEQTERMAPWPADAVSGQRDLLGQWHFTTRADRQKARVSRMQAHIRAKRAEGVIERRAVYVWTFFVPGPFYSGWWVYLVGIDKQQFEGDHIIHGGGVKRQLSGELLQQAMRLFPVNDQRPLFHFAHTEDWAEAFARRYPARRQRGRRPQGKAFCWAVIDESGNVERLEAAV